MAKQKSKSKPPVTFDENPVWGTADFAAAAPMSEAFPHIMKAARRGRPKLANPKVQVSLRLDPLILKAFKSTGPGWQKLINMTLAKKAKTLRPRSKRAA